MPRAGAQRLQAERAPGGGASAGTRVDLQRVTICPELIRLKFFPLDLSGNTSRMLQYLASHKTETLNSLKNILAGY